VARTHLQHGVARLRSELRDELAADVVVDEEVLAERSLGVDHCVT